VKDLSFEHATLPGNFGGLYAMKFLSIDNLVANVIAVMITAKACNYEYSHLALFYYVVVYGIFVVVRLVQACLTTLTEIKNKISNT
jgi:hypothetical protein